MMIVKFLLLIFVSGNIRADGLLSFDKALEQIREQSLDVLLGTTSVNKADWGVSAREYKFLPTVAVSGSQIPASPGFPSALNTVQGSVTLNLFRGGADSAALSAARSDKRSQDFGFMNARLNSELEGAKILVSHLEKQEQLAILSRSVSTFNDALKIARQRYQKGLLPLQEVNKVSVDFDNANARLNDAQTQALDAKADLVRLLGHDHIEVFWPWKNRLKKKEFQILTSKEVRLDSRPDYMAAVFSLAAEEGRSRQAFRTMIPSLDFTVSEGYSQYLNQQNGSFTAATLTLTLPLFNALSDFAAYKVQMENQAAAEHKVIQLKRDVRSLSQAAQRKFEVALATALAREKTLEISQRLYEANQIRFRQGRASANDIAVDQNRLTDSELLALRGWSGAHLALVQLCHVFGQLMKECETQP